jgi:hypothetical protein
MLRRLLLALSLTVIVPLAPSPASAETQNVIEGKVKKILIDYGHIPAGQVVYLLDGLAELSVSPEWTINFDEGANKGIVTIQTDGTARDGATGVLNYAYVSMGSAGGGRVVPLVYASLGAGQTLDLAMAAGGLDVTGDQADDEGFEIVGGMLGAVGAPIIPGTTPAVKFCATISMADVSDTDELFIGWRKPEPINATFANYDTYYAVGIQASAATAAIHRIFEDDGGGQDNDDTTLTWADGATKVLCAHVSAASVATVSVNGTTASAPSATTLDDGEPLVPFFRWLHAGAADGTPKIATLEVAYSR